MLLSNNKDPTSGTTIWVDLKICWMREINLKKITYSMMLFMWHSQSDNNVETENIWLLGGEENTGEAQGGLCGEEVLFLGRGTIAQICACDNMMCSLHQSTN